MFQEYSLALSQSLQFTFINVFMSVAYRKALVIDQVGGANPPSHLRLLAPRIKITDPKLATFQRFYR